MMTKAEELARAQGRIEGLMEAAEIADEYEMTILQAQKDISTLENMQMVSSLTSAQLADRYRAQADKLKRELAGTEKPAAGDSSDGL